jgi:hypothetical protein
MNVARMNVTNEATATANLLAYLQVWGMDCALCADRSARGCSPCGA